MKKTLTLLLIITSLYTYSQMKPETDDQKSIAKIIMKSYVDAIHNLENIENIHRGFHPGFELLINKNDQLVKYPIYNWSESVKQRARTKDEKPLELTECKFLFIDVTKDAAVAKIELLRGGELIFTDYLSLYRFKDGWRIVSKIYTRHKQEDPDNK